MISTSNGGAAFHLNGFQSKRACLHRRIPNIKILVERPLEMQYAQP